MSSVLIILYILGGYVHSSQKNNQLKNTSEANDMFFLPLIRVGSFSEPATRGPGGTSKLVVVNAIITIALY